MVLMPSFRIVTLGCKVNHYESLQIAETLQRMGYARSESASADLLILNTCSVTAAAAAKSRNLLRRYHRPEQALETPDTLEPAASDAFPASQATAPGQPRVIAVGCWATSHAETARRIAGVDAIITHQENLAQRLHDLLAPDTPFSCANPTGTGAITLSPLSQRQPQNQRAILKIQDGCDAHCTYCILPKLRPTLYSKPLPEVLEEARRMVDAGHHEIVLTGIFLGAYGQSTALHRRQKTPAAGLAQLIEALCTQVTGLKRLRISSLEPADVTDHLLGVLSAHPQIMPHFHLPLQSGSELILSRMNRQYTRMDYLTMLDKLRSKFDRPALTTDIIVGFPGEMDAEFTQTYDLARRAGFLHIHAFPFSPREGTAAAKWKGQFVHQQFVTDRMQQLERLNLDQSRIYREKLMGHTAEVLVERPGSSDTDDRGPAGAPDAPTVRHGRCERYFSVHFESPEDLTGQLVKVKITRVTPYRTIGERV